MFDEDDIVVMRNEVLAYPDWSNVRYNPDSEEVLAKDILDCYVKPAKANYSKKFHPWIWEIDTSGMHYLTQITLDLESWVWKIDNNKKLVSGRL